MGKRKWLTWLQAVEQVLEESEEPLHSDEIARRAIHGGLVKTAGKWPEHSVQSVVWRHIKEFGNPIGFEMIGDGRRSRYYWLARKGAPRKQ